MNLHELTNRIAADAVSVDFLLPSRLRAMRDSMAGQPAAQHFEPVRSGHATLHCWVHERDLNECAKAELSCSGEAIDHHDPTGEAAVNAAMGGDPAANDHRALQRHLAAAGRELDAALTIMRRYEDAKLTIDRAGIGLCAECRRYCDGRAGSRLSAYRGGDLICAACRARRDRAAKNERCGSACTHHMVAVRCSLPAGHREDHRGAVEEWTVEWDSSGSIREVAA